MRSDRLATSPSVSLPSQPKPEPGRETRKPKQSSWLSRSGKNQPQWNAVGASSFVFLSGGMSLAWGAGFAAHSRHRERLTRTQHMQICWFGAALLGAMVSAVLTHRTPQRPLYVSSILSIISIFAAKQILELGLCVASTIPKKSILSIISIIFAANKILAKKVLKKTYKTIDSGMQ